VKVPVRLLAIAFLLNCAAWGQVIPKLSPVFTYLCLNDFQTCPNGYNPVSSPLQIGNASFFYAVAFNGGQGGASAGGTIVRTNTTGLGGAIYTFQPGQHKDFPDGNHPGVAFVAGPDGNFYGVTQKGGNHDSGVMFRLSPSGAVQKVYDFCSLSGCIDTGTSLMLAKDGNFYGIASKTFYRISTQGVWTQIATLPVNLGLNTQLIQAKDGNFYGANYIQNDGNGVAFRLTPSGQYAELHRFDANSVPSCPLIQGTDGNLYGATINLGPGTGIFRLTLSGDYKIIHELTSQQGYNPSQILQASDGNIWGLTAVAGGTFFRIRLDGLLLDTGLFDCNKTGCLPEQMIQASDGNFYGVAGAGGPAPPDHLALGAIFKLSAGLPRPQ
jgi:uncharacterized repeat protein (TIGR03803 family)